MAPPVVRCHLLIGPPGSGKTTLASKLAPLLQGADGQPAAVLCTDAIRAELFGDASVQGPWGEIRAVLLERLQQAVASGSPVILDATHARRPWRLLYTQAMTYPRPVEWIGWWLTTPLSTCQAWAQQRQRPVPDAVIREFAAALAHRFFGPDRSEGFATIVRLNPAADEASAEALGRHLGGLERRIRNAVNRDRARQPHLHRYSRLLDLERLLFLLRLLTSFNGLDGEDPGTAAALAQICNPPPSGDRAERAAAYLAGWSAVHGGQAAIYADAEAIRMDLAWLETQGFGRLSWDGDPSIDPGDPDPAAGSGVHGGWPAPADRRVFVRVFSLLRHILKEPFDAPEPPTSLHGHLIERLADLEGTYGEGQEAALRYDVEHLLRPYGFLPVVQGRPSSVRQGYAIGTAVLSADQLLEVHGLLKASLDRLSDAAQLPLLEALEDRLQRAGLLPAAGPERHGHPARLLAHRTLTEATSGSLADPAQARRLERAICDRRRIWLQPQPENGDGGRFRAWPLQLLFHNIAWYLALEEYAIGRSHGLIRTVRVDRLTFLGNDGNTRRNSESEHGAALQRLQRVLQVGGGLYCGEDLEAQLLLMEGGAGLLDASGMPVFERLRFSCTPEVFRWIREEPRRFPPEHTAYSRPIPGLSNWPPGPLDTLTPNAASDSHPYPVELLLPRWSVRKDWDLRNWLFRWGAGVRIEEPAQLRELHAETAQRVLEVYQAER